jgi:Metallo-peptidase family M12
MRLQILPTFFFCCFLSVTVTAQRAPVATLIDEAHQSGTSFVTIRPFQPTTVTDAKALEFAPDAQFLEFDPTALYELWLQRPEGVTLVLPYHGEEISVDLVPNHIFTDDFTVVTSELDEEVFYNRGLYYQGIVPREANSVAGVNFFEEEVIGIISTPRHQNLVLGRLDIPGNKYRYILYSDAELTQTMPFECHARKPSELTKAAPRIDDQEYMVSGCVAQYFEVDYELFQNKGSVQNTLNYVTSMFAQVAILFTNEVVPTRLNQIYVWVTPDPYASNPSGGPTTVLDQFQHYRRSKYNADVANLIGIGGNNLGGFAFVDAICIDDSALSYSDIDASFSNVPTYSWTINVVTHEIGHVMGADHTHDCAWFAGAWQNPPATGTLAIDGCQGAVGGCANGPVPPSGTGGTIMSYCHLTSTGINFANGFGPQPGDCIRWKNGPTWSPCLATSCAPLPSCQAPSSISIVNVYSTAIRLSWGAVSGATSYGLQWRQLPNTTWNTVNNITSPYLLGGLPFNDTLEIQFITTCGATNSEYRTGIIAKTNTTAPVELLYFRERTSAAPAIVLEWATATESQSAYFDVEKSLDGLQWQVIGSVEATGDTRTQQNYSLEDPAKPRAVQYYRLVEISQDNTPARYGSIAIKRASLDCQPSIAVTASQWILNNPCDEALHVVVVNALGQVISNGAMPTIDQPNGHYFVQYWSAGRLLKTDRVVLR